VNSTPLRVFTLAIFLILGRGYASASFLDRDTTKADTTIVSKIDSLAEAKKDSLPLRIFPIPLVGSIDKKLSPEFLITDSIINFFDYKLASDLFSMNNGVFTRDLGSPGQFSALNINGMEGREISFLADGVPLREPMNGLYDMNLYPLEHAERIEFIADTRAFLYDINSTGGVINFVSRSKKEIRPYSRIHYNESAYGYSLFDGMFSQDIYRGVNTTAGVQHSTTKGRFNNSDFDAWNLRMKIRYNMSNSFNMYASTMYNQTVLGLNGGDINLNQLLLQNGGNLDSVVNQYAYEKITRYDHQLGLAMKITSDSTLVSTLTMYHSSSLREYREPVDATTPEIFTVKQDHQSQWYGARFSHFLTLGQQRFDLNAEVERRGVIASPVTGRQLDTRTALYGKSETFLFGHINFAGYSRIDRYLDQSRLSYGADAGINPDTNFYFFGGFSHSYRFPTIEERFWNDRILSSASFSAPTEQHDLLEAGIRIRNSETVSGELKYFHRDIHDGIIIAADSGTSPSFHYAIDPKLTVHGVSGNLSIRIGKFFAEGSGQFINYSDSSVSLVPHLTGTGGLYYWTELLDGHLHLKTGLRGRLVPSYLAPGYDPEVQYFLPGKSTETDLVGLMDVIFIAKIGSAYIHLVWNNFFDRKYYITSIYPMPDRALQFGVSWEFAN
jgi:outer membrane cobalamin receptor